MAEDLRTIANLDRTIHEPARLMIMIILYSLEEADFVFLQHATGLTKGNLGAHLSRLEEARYLEVEKTFQGKVPRTLYRMTDKGRDAFRLYRRQLQRILDI